MADVVRSQLEWDATVVNLGDVEVGKKYPVTFTYMGKDTILNVVPGCSCTVASVKNNVVTVIYKIPQLSPLVNSTIQPTVKTIAVTLTDGENQRTQILTIKAVRHGK